MKKIILSIMAVASLVACTNDEVVSFDKQEIAFGSAFVDNSTRAAADPSYSTATNAEHPLTQFNVYGAVNNVNIYSGQTVSKGNAEYGAEWSIQSGTPTQYWVPGANYIFDAVVDASAVTTDNTTGLPTSLNCKASEQKDMLHCRVSRPENNNTSIVAFDFTHLLSKVKFTVQNTTAASAENYRYTISDINLTNVITEGNYAVPAGTWTTASTGTYTIPSLEVASNSTVECANEVLLIPGNTVGISLKVNVQIKNGDNWETLTTTPVTNAGIALVANHAYNFKLTVGLNNEIKFSAQEMDAWDGPNDAGDLQF